ncbi:hypothetical protein LUZ63_002619 [Rhynchospora breviuscula]|uniref:Uncharacterized protein n=1 Tax=Rhynchospora breviuscula TaxID=2022672 RepID=A0A9Q0HYN5_9POAL|nr:hypothetical protein LUZ63_002619 [Rhynchospora breviuscula]
MLPLYSYQRNFSFSRHLFQNRLYIPLVDITTQLWHSCDELLLSETCMGYHYRIMVSSQLLLMAKAWFMPSFSDQTNKEVRETVIPNSEAADSVPTTEAPSHGIGLALEFKPVEHPVEPVNHDQPIKCPLPEPSILNDGRIWKERMTSLGARVRTDLRVVREGSQLEPDSGGSRPKPVIPRRAILPSMSAPERHFVELLEECDNPSIENANSSD